MVSLLCSLCKWSARDVPRILLWPGQAACSGRCKFVLWQFNLQQEKGLDSWSVVEAMKSPTTDPSHQSRRTQHVCHFAHLGAFFHCHPADDSQIAERNGRQKL